METATAFTFERTEDLVLVKSILTNPAIYQGAKDDFSPPPDQFEVNDGFQWILARIDGELMGLWALAPQSHILWEVHTCLLPEAWGEDAAAAAKEFLEWVWTETTCLRLFTRVPACSRTAMAFAKKAGMKESGIEPMAFKKHGKLWDMYTLGISSPYISTAETT